MALIDRLAKDPGLAGRTFAAGVFSLIMREITEKCKKAGKIKPSRSRTEKLEANSACLEYYSPPGVTGQPLFCYTFRVRLEEIHQPGGLTLRPMS
jgi:hypothetical protein